jgi:hypothetical protein
MEGNNYYCGRSQQQRDVSDEDEHSSQCRYSSPAPYLHDKVTFLAPVTTVPVALALAQAHTVDCLTGEQDSKHEQPTNAIVADESPQAP